MAEDNMYLENLREFIYEEDKIVTYKWLSRTLSVHVNLAKQMLYAFAQIEKEQKKDSITIVYIIGGVIENENGQLIHKYLFSHEEDLEDLKKCFAQLTSLHIYSVQKHELKDSNVLYTTDYDLAKQNIECSNRWSNITCKLATQRKFTQADVEHNHHDNVAQNHEVELKSNGVTDTVKNDPPAPTASSLPTPVPSTSATSKSKKTTKSKGKPMKKGDVASFFSRQAFNNNKAQDEKPKEEEKTQKDKANNANEMSEQSRQNSSSKGEENEKEMAVKNDEGPEQDTLNEEKSKNKGKAIKKGKSHNKEKMKSGAKTEKRPSPEGKKKSKANEDVDEKPKRGVKRPNKTKTSPNENDGTNVEHKQKGKKRRRVKNFSESSGEEEVHVETPRDENAIDASEDSTPIPDQQPEALSANVNNATVKARRTRKVLKSKTYLNDEGYMVTEKVYENESEECSDEEQPAAMTSRDKMVETKTTVKDVPKKAVPKKKPVQKPTKQASLTSFFKKA